MRYPLHRSLLLWGALLLVGFTGWVWVDSREMDTYVSWRGISVGSAENGTYAVMWRSLSPGTSIETGRERTTSTFPEEVAPPPFFLRGTRPEFTGTNTDELKEVATARNVKEFITEEMSRHPPQAWMLFIPYWVVMIGTVVVAGGLILWRARRWRRWQRMQVEGSTGEAVGG